MWCQYSVLYNTTNMILTIITISSLLSLAAGENFLPDQELENHEAAPVYYQDEGEYQQGREYNHLVKQFSSTCRLLDPYSLSSVPVSNYPDYQQYPDYSPVQYQEVDNHLYDPYHVEADEYQETEALQYQDDRYQTNYADSLAIQSRSDTELAPASRLERLWNRISEFMKNFMLGLEERSRSGHTDRLLSIVAVTSLIVGSILAL